MLDFCACDTHDAVDTFLSGHGMIFCYCSCYGCSNLKQALLSRMLIFKPLTFGGSGSNLSTPPYSIRWSSRNLIASLKFIKNCSEATEVAKLCQNRCCKIFHKLFNTKLLSIFGDANFGRYFVKWKCVKYFARAILAQLCHLCCCWAVFYELERCY